MVIFFWKNSFNFGLKVFSSFCVHDLWFLSLCGVSPSSCMFHSYIFLTICPWPWWTDLFCLPAPCIPSWAILVVKLYPELSLALSWFSFQLSFLQCLFPFCFHIMNWLPYRVSCLFVLSRKTFVPFTNCSNIFIIIPLNSGTSVLSESLSRGATTLDLLIWEKTRSPDVSRSFCLCTWVCLCEVRWIVKVFDSFQITSLLSVEGLYSI